MDYSKLIVVISVLVPFFAHSFKEDLVKSDHSNCSYLTTSQHLKVHNRMLSRSKFFFRLDAFHIMCAT